MHLLGELSDGLDTLEESCSELNKLKAQEARSYRRFIMTTFLVTVGLLIALASFILG